MRGDFREMHLRALYPLTAHKNVIARFKACVLGCLEGFGQMGGASGGFSCLAALRLPLCRTLADATILSPRQAML